MTESARIRVRVTPGSRDASVVGRYGDAWKLRISEAPERGRANEGVLSLLARVLSLSQRNITLVSGHSSRDKIIELEGIDSLEIERRLAADDRKEP